jgi:hypothetical protein
VVITPIPTTRPVPDFSEGCDPRRVVFGIGVVPISAVLPSAPSGHFALRGTGLFLFQSLACGTKFVDLVEHSFQEGFGGGRGDPCPLELADFAPLRVNLNPHPLNCRRIQAACSNAFSICRRTAVVGRPSRLKSLSRFHNLMISRSFTASMHSTRVRTQCERKENKPQATDRCSIGGTPQLLRSCGPMSVAKQP